MFEGANYPTVMYSISLDRKSNTLTTRLSVIAPPSSDVRP